MIACYTNTVNLVSVQKLVTDVLLYVHSKMSKTLMAIMSIRLVKLLSEIHIVAIHIDRLLNSSEIITCYTNTVNLSVQKLVTDVCILR